ncbi:glutamine synthetase family protein [Pendulispora brunnea]|uniref:Glutamine synthetase family protein n=1 Tax=Pendulispora brunnea TaxID=2905690 RepID=A0ABZ2K5E8_9BACT
MRDGTNLRAEFEARGIRKVKVGGFDVDGVLRGKYVALDKFWSALEHGFGFCDVIFGWDIADVLYDNAKVTGWSTGYPDAHARIDPETFRVIPWEPDTAAFLVDFVQKDGSAHAACPRSLFKSVLARAQSRGFDPVFSAEYEFFIFRESAESLHEKGFRNLTPLSPGMFGYSWVREGQHAELLHDIMDRMAAFDIPIEGLHTETGPGVYEVALRYDAALRMADKAALFKTAMKQLCASRGLSVTFMAKWNADLPGASGHLHQSLWRRSDKTNAFYDPSDPQKLSKIARHYVGGQIANMATLTALYSPTINSYKRYVPGVWAPLTASWGVENRTCAIRAIPGDEKSTRLEYRQTAADMNPYIAMAACLGAGLWGIENEVEPPAEGKGDTSGEGSGFQSLPRTLKDATALLSRCNEARAILGEPFVDHYVRTRDWEVRQYERVVTEWELRRYFEAV